VWCCNLYINIDERVIMLSITWHDRAHKELKKMGLQPALDRLVPAAASRAGGSRSHCILLSGESSTLGQDGQIREESNYL